MCQGCFQQERPYLAKMGRNIVHCGGPGTGQVAKVCNNLILGISMTAVSEATTGFCTRNRTIEQTAWLERADHDMRSTLTEKSAALGGGRRLVCIGGITKGRGQES